MPEIVGLFMFYKKLLKNSELSRVVELYKDLSATPGVRPIEAFKLKIQIKNTEVEAGDAELNYLDSLIWSIENRVAKLVYYKNFSLHAQEQYWEKKLDHLEGLICSLERDVDNHVYYKNFSQQVQQQRWDNDYHSELQLWWYATMPERLANWANSPGIMPDEVFVTPW